MISLENFVQMVEEGEQPSLPLDVSFSEGLHYLAESQKEIFDICSFSFTGIAEGKMIIDGFEVTNDVATLGRIIVYRIGVDGFATLSSIFVLPQGFKASIKRRKEISTAIAELRNLPGETIEDKANKLSALYDTLEKEGASYVLIDNSLKINSQHKEEIERIVSQKPLTTLILTFIPKTKAKPQKKVIVLEEDADLSSFLCKDASLFIFEAVFGLIYSFCICGGICLIGGGNISLGIITLLVAVVCLVMTTRMLSFTYERSTQILKNENSYTKIQIMLGFVELFSAGIGLILAYLLAANDVVLPYSSSLGVALVVCIIMDLLLIVASLFPHFCHRVWFGRKNRDNKNKNK